MNRILTLNYLKERRSFVWSLIYRDIRNRYAHSLLGVSWMVIEPMLLVLSLSAIFAIVGRNQIFDGTKEAPFPIFFYCGILPWMFFAKTLTDGTQTFVREASLLSKYSFPREILVAKNVLIYLIEFFLASLAFAVIVLLYGFEPTAQWFWLGPLLGLMMLMCTGIILMMASLNVYIRDVSKFLITMSSILFWLSPVIYRIDLNNLSRYILYVNPFAGVIESFRVVILDDRAPPFDLVVWPVLWTVALLLGGYRVFRKLEKGMVDAL